MGASGAPVEEGASHHQDQLQGDAHQWPAPQAEAEESDGAQRDACVRQAGMVVAGAVAAIPHARHAMHGNARRGEGHWRMHGRQDKGQRNEQ